MLVNKNINTLSGGVSQQPYELRFDNQVEDMENFVVTVASGLRRRNPIDVVTNIDGMVFNDNVKIHSYDRGDGVEKYFIIINDDGLRVFNELGKEKTVGLKDNVISNWIGQFGTNWKSALQLVTVGDTTWILNKESIVGGGYYNDVVNENKAFLWINKTTEIRYGDNGNSKTGYTYEITLNGETYKAEGSNSTNSIDALRYIVSEMCNINEVITAIDDVYDTSEYDSMFKRSIDYTITAGNSIAIYAWDNEDESDISEIHSYNGGDYGHTAVITSYKKYYRIVGTTSSLEVSIAYSSEWKVKSVGSIIMFSRFDGSDFEYLWGDSFGNQASSGWRDNVNKMKDLPVSMKGFTSYEVGTIAITGTTSDDFNDYYVAWDDEEDRWYETYRPNQRLMLDPTTLPAKLVRQSDDKEYDFILGYNTVNDNHDGFETEWGQRLKGDEDTNPDPSFYGTNIENMFFFKNRLGFTSGESVVLSRTGEYYDFFASTVLDILDSDPIDVSIDSNSVSYIRDLTVTGNSVTLWSDNAQFLLSGGEILSPLSTRVAQVSSYNYTKKISPIAIDNEVIFFSETGSYLSANAYSGATLQSDTTTAESISAHLPKYIPNSIVDATASTANNMLFLLDGVNKNTIYVYKYFAKGNEKVINAWFKWTFNETIRAIDVLNNVLYIYANEKDVYKMILEEQNIESLFLDKGSDTYISNVLMSSFNIQSNENSKIIREPFYLKNIKVNVSGIVDLYIKSNDRNDRITTTKNKHLGRKIFVGGNTNKTNIGFYTDGVTGCQIDTINIEGIIKLKSRNI